MKRIIMVVLLVLFLSGCSKEVNTEAYLSEAERLLSSNIDEQFTYSSTEVVDAKSEYYKYYFTSNSRDITISVDTYMDAGVRQYKTNYFVVLSNLYLNDVITILENSSFSVDKSTLTVTIKDPNDFKQLAELLYNCEYLIGKENVYHNDGYFTLENPFLKVRILMEGYEKFDYEYSLSGYYTSDDIYNFIYNYYMSIE